MSGPLAGKRVVVTRPPADAMPLVAMLRERGAKAFVIPTVAIEPVADRTPLVDAISRLREGAYDWLVLTSANSCSALADPSIGSWARRSFQVAVIGNRTAEVAMRSLNLRADFMPVNASALGIANELPISAGEHILLPQSDIAPPLLAQSLRSRGAVVDVITAYRTTQRVLQDNERDLLCSGAFEAVVFASPSAVRGFMQAISPSAPDPDAIAICIGPRTTHAAHVAGFSQVATAAKPIAASLLEVVENALQSGQRMKEVIG
jgi:uroporphyrinogen-III synthase